jgi:hypothetical protein
MTDAPKWTWTKVHALAWNRFRVNDLNIAASLAGETHHLTVDGRPVTIQLPSFPPDAPGVMHQWDDDAIYCHSRRYGKPLAFLISEVDVVVDTGKKLGVPLERLNTALFDWQSPATHEKHEKLSEQSAAIAVKAFNLWVRTLRWKVVKPYFGQRRFDSPRSGWSTYLYDAKTKQRFFGAALPIEARGFGTPIDRAGWKRVQRALTAGGTPPLWFDFVFEGQDRIMQGDLHGGILCLAVGVETVIRKLMKAHLRNPPNEPVMEMLDFVVIRRILDQWEDLGYWSPAWQAATDLTHLKRLFTLRNDVIHKAVVPTDKAECTRVGKAALQFILQASSTAERLT